MKNSVLMNIESTRELLDIQEKTIEVRGAMVALDRFEAAINGISSLAPFPENKKVVENEVPEKEDKKVNTDKKKNNKQKGAE